MIIYKNISLLLLIGVVSVGGLGRPVSTNHILLIHCPVAREMWSMVFTLFGACWVMPSGVVELLTSWPGKFSRQRNGMIRNMIPHCLMWSIWWEGNTQVFEGTERSIHELKLFFFFPNFTWVDKCIGCFQLYFFACVICLITVLSMHLSIFYVFLKKIVGNSLTSEPQNSLQ